MNQKALSPFVQCIAVAILGSSVLMTLGCEKKPTEPVTPKVADASPGSIPVAVPNVIAAVSINGARKVTGWQGWPGFPAAPSGK